MRAVYVFTDGNGGPVTLRENLAENLQRLMDEHKLKQKDFAKRVGFSEATVSTWINKKIWPEPENMERVAAAFGIEADLLYLDPNSPKTNPQQIAQDLNRLAKRLGYVLRKAP